MGRCKRREVSEQGNLQKFINNVVVMSLRKSKKSRTDLRVPASHRPATMISVARSCVPWESPEKRFSFATPSTFPKNEEFFGSRLTSPQDLFMLGFGKRKVD